MNTIHASFKYNTIQSKNGKNNICANSAQSFPIDISTSFGTDEFVTTKQITSKNRPAFKGLFSSIFQIKTTNDETSDLMETFSDEEIKKLETICCSSSKYETNKKLLKKAVELKKLGISFLDTVSIIAKCNSAEKKVVDSLTCNLPPSLKKGNDIGQFINLRLIATRYKRIKNNKEYYSLNEKAFDFFNELYKKYNDLEQIYNIDQVVELSNYLKLNNEMQKFILDMSQYMQPDDIYKTVGSVNNQAAYPYLIKTFELLDKKDKTQISAVVSNFRNKAIQYEDCVSPELLRIFIENYPKYKDKFSAEHIAKSIHNLTTPLIHKKTDIKLLSPQKLDFMIKIDDYDRQKTHSLLFTKESNTFTEKGQLENAVYADKLLDNGYSTLVLFIDADSKSGLFDWRLQQNEKESYVNDALKLLKQNIASKYINKFVNKELAEDKALVLDIRNEALKRRDILTPAGDELSCKDIDEVFFKNWYNTAKTIRTIGKDALLYSFAEKIDNVEDYIETIGEYCDPMGCYYEELVEITNPTKSKLYKAISSQIQWLKNQLKEAPTIERTELIKEINAKNKELNFLVKNAIKDPKQKLETALIYAAISEVRDSRGFDFDDSGSSLPCLADIIYFMNPKTEEKKEKYNKKLNEIIWAILDIDFPHQETLNRLDFRNNKYLSKLFNADGDFKDNFAKLVAILDSNPNKSTLSIFNNLPQNLETIKQFNKYKLNYSNWVTQNPNLKIELKIKTDNEKQKQSAIRNLESDFNDELFKKIPTAETEKLFKALNQEGFKVLKKDDAIYENNGFLNGTKKVLKFYKDNKPIEFEDLSRVIKIIKTEINNNEFWNKSSDDNTVNTAKETIKNHLLKLRYNEIKTATTKKADKEINIVVQKANMNDIKHSLFLGNDASCCTAVGTGFNQWSAPTYVMNKLVSCIEVKDGNNCVGNTMMYIADIHGKPALILDNIELKSKYQYNDKIRDAIFEYAEIVTKELGKPDMHIYAGPNRHKVNLDNFPLELTEFKIIGSTGDDKIYLDFDAEPHAIKPNDFDNNFCENLYLIR